MKTVPVNLIPKLISHIQITDGHPALRKRLHDAVDWSIDQLGDIIPLEQQNMPIIADRKTIRLYKRADYFMDMFEASKIFEQYGENQFSCILSNNVIHPKLINHVYAN